MNDAGSHTKTELSDPDNSVDRSTKLSAGEIHQERLEAGRACLQMALGLHGMGHSPLILCDPKHIGIATLPTHKKCDSPGKAPFLATWKEFQTCQPTIEEITEWWGKYPIGNLGLVLGTTAVRIDADGNLSLDYLLEWSGGDLPNTWAYTTPASPHPQYLYSWPLNDPAKTVTQKLKGVHSELKLLGFGGQTVIPPSRHPRGGFYEWLPGCSPDDIPIAPAPAWLAERMTAKKPPRKTFAPVTTSTNGASNTAEAILAKQIKQIANAELGARHDTRIQAGYTIGGLVASGCLPESAIEELVEAARANSNNPDQAERDIRDTTTAGRDVPLEPNANKGKASAPKQSIVANHLIEGYRHKVAYDGDGRSYVEYESKQHGIWSPLDGGVMDRRIKHDMEATEFYPLGFDWSVQAGIEHMVRVELLHKFEPLPHHLIPFNNGVLNTKDMSFSPHDASRFLTWVLGYDYDPAADCEPIQRWLLEAMEGDKGRVRVLRAYMAAVLRRWVYLQLYLECIGIGGSGKGTFTRLVMALIGYNNTKPTELSQLELNRFELSNLRGKQLIVITDEDKYGGGVANLKKLTGQDVLRGEIKNKQKHVDFVADGLVIVAANQAIQSNDYTSGLARRRITVPFRVTPKEPRQLIEFANEKPVGEFAPHLPGLVNWVLSMEVKDVEDTLRKATAASPAMLDAKMENLVATNPLAAWANEKLVYRPDDETRAHVGVLRVSKDDGTYENLEGWLYPNYVKHAKESGHLPVASTRFSDLLVDLLRSQLGLDAVFKKRDTVGVSVNAVRIRRESDKDDLLITPTQSRSY